jgi:predicted TIM-barrel fold metal-dependent hydrolase
LVWQTTALVAGGPPQLPEHAARILRLDVRNEPDTGVHRRGPPQGAGAQGLPFLLPRLEHRLDKQHDGVGLGNARRKVSEYFSDNFYVTTSGHFHTRALFNAISELGVDRVMFSADYPYETMEEASAWFDTSLLCHNDALKVGRENARRLFASTIR